MYSLVVPWVIFPLHERLTAHRFWSGFRELEALQWLSQDELQNRSFRALRPLLFHAYKHVPLYREKFESAGIDPSSITSLDRLDLIPVTTKSELRLGFPERVVAGNLAESRRRQDQTSGSTGLPLAFYSDRQRLDLVRSSYLLFLSWAGIWPWVTRLVVCNAQHFYRHRVGGGLIERTVRKYLVGERVLRVQGSGMNASEFLKLFRDPCLKRYYYLMSFPSYANRLASQILSEGVELPAYPKVFVSTGETLTNSDSALLEKAFRCRVFNYYGSMEFPYLAHSCPDHPEFLHVNSDRGIVRVVREDGTDAAIGESGRILVTDLVNYVMPFINYDIGDRGVAGGRCPCGRGLPTIQRVDGRSSEVIRSPDGKEISAQTLGPLLFEVWETMPFIWEYQFVQHSLTEVILRIVPTPAFTAEFGAALQKDLERFFGTGMRVVIQTVERIDPGPSGKRSIIETTLSENDY